MARLVVAAIGITMFLLSWMSFQSEHYAKAFASGGIGIAIVAFLVLHARRTRGRRAAEAQAEVQRTQAVPVGDSGASPASAGAGALPATGKRRKWSLASTVLAIAIFGGIAWVVSSPERTASRVKTGMSKEQAIAAVGRPAQWEGAALPECQSGNSERCRNAKQSGAVRYLKWQTFVDAALIVGICADGRVCFIAQEG